MKNCLIIQHYDSTTAGSSFEWLVKNSIPFQVWRIDSRPEPDLSKFDSLIVCGGKQNVDEEHLYPWLKREKEIIREWSESGKPLVGLCLGGQLLAESLGGKVGRHIGWEVGWHPVEIVDSHTKITAFQYHQYSFVPPSKAKIIAKGDFCNYQGFSYKRSLGFQFHPESSKEWIVQCTHSIRDEYQGQVQKPNEILEKLAFQAPLQEWFFKTLDKWRSGNI